MKSIRTRILLCVISGLVVITAVVSAIAVSMTHEVMHKDADRILNNVAQKEAAYINDALGDVEKSAAIMKHYVLSEISSMDQLKDLEFRGSYLHKARKMFAEVALNTKGVEGWYYRLNPEFTDGTTGFYELITEDSQVVAMPVTDLSLYSDRNHPSVSWYYTAIDQGGPFWQAPYYFPGHSKQLISYTIPVYIGEDLLGLVGIDMDFEYLMERIDQITVYDEGFAVLLASDGVSRYNNQDRPDGSQPHTKATAPLENGMYLELRAEYQDIQKSIRPMLRKIVLAFSGVLLLSIVYTVGVTFRIINPLKELTVLAEGFSAGEIVEVQWPSENAQDEIGTLSRVLKKTYQKIEDYTIYINALAYRDGLTGTKNNTAYKQITDQLNQDILAGTARFGVLMVDINNLKTTNDRYGHVVGDMLIVKTAHILMDTFPNSSVFRVGGDEFVAILAGEDCENHRDLLIRLERLVAENDIVAGEGRVSVSFASGLAVFDPAVDKTYGDVFSRADHAMYTNKERCKVLL